MSTHTTAAEVETIAESADAAARAWRKAPSAKRAHVIRAIADELDAAGDTLVPIAQRETNLAEGRLRGELKRTTFQLRLFAEVIIEGDYLGARIDHADADWPMGAPRPDLRRMQIPLGPVVVFAASNFPFAFSVAGGDTASALAAGCSVILKAHSGHPQLSVATAEAVVRAAADAGAPAGLFTLITGTEAGRTALEHPAVKAGAFTGSISGGRALFDIAQSRPEPIPFYGELGSVNPVLVTQSALDSDGDAIIEGFMGSFTMGAGQFCTKPGLLVVPKSGEVAERLRGLEVPAAAPLLNGRIQSSYASELERLSQHSAVAAVVRHDRWLSDPPVPTVLRVDIARVLADTETLVTEVFGPTAVLVEYDDEQQLVELCEKLQGQLTITVFAEPDDHIAPTLLEAAAQRSGRVLWKQWPTGVSVSYAQQHGGPYPATTAVGTTSVGTAAIERFVRPVAFQNVPDELLPVELQDANPLGITRRVDSRN